MSTLSNTVDSPRVPVLADLFANTWIKNAVLVLGGALFMALFQQISFSMEPFPAPITGGTLGVLLIGSALGSRRGAAALLLYLMMGLILPVYSEGREGAEVLFNTASTGYFLGYLIAAYVVGYLAEHGRDRKFQTAFVSFLFCQLIIFACGVLGLMIVMNFDFPTAFHDGFVLYIPIELIKAAIGAILLPAAWKLAEKTR
ncbi:MAG TPA: biotin transporter BioY [Solirubrobacterales bacterium]|jgi:biotin transport system substrate-specific component|nr:biotin transporter BioY [Solirubrobacterales bacterium]HMU28251.1 biotin transporter BioY [Solirubrobacterales bacterium]HMX72467.1 biotin transporter BioY [Solirubrobacterales bacterium]HMY26994.1 biotin transporter BioY [Solirubrobacterales bacterium]HNC06104.1 biotin transporter BioY [Solirubrobacterales bacterium]